MNYIALRDPIQNTPLLPGYYSSKDSDYFALNYGKRKRKRKPKRTSGGHIYKMAKAMGVKASKNGKRKTVRSLWNNIFTRGKHLLKKNHPDCKHTKYLKRHVKSMAKKLKVKQRGKSPLRIWNGINTAVKKQMPKKKRGRRTKRRKSSFGTYWDNTQKTYANACASQQCASASTVGGPYPFYRPAKSNWVPYYQIKGNAFGY